MNRLLWLPILAFSFSITTLSSQIGGLTNFEFLRLPVSSQATALGGSLVALKGKDPAQFLNNPASVDSLAHNTLSFNHNFHFAGISNGTFAYSRNILDNKFVGTFGIQYISYGDFQLTDEIGQVNGTFTGRETSINLGVTKQLNERIRAGVNAKFITSSFESFTASGIGLDVGIIYQKPNARASWGLSFRNIGTQLSTFNNEDKALPFDIQLGFTNRLKHLPFRFSIIAQRLDRWNIRFDDPDRNDDGGLFMEVQEQSSFSKNVDNFFRHFIFSGEFLFGKNETFSVRFAYNHLLRRELQVSSFRSLGGFSAGFGLMIKKISLNYGVGYYHLAGASNNLSVRINLDSFRRKI